MEDTTTLRILLSIQTTSISTLLNTTQISYLTLLTTPRKLVLTARPFQLLTLSILLHTTTFFSLSTTLTHSLQMVCSICLTELDSWEALQEYGTLVEVGVQPIRSQIFQFPFQTCHSTLIKQSSRNGLTRRVEFILGQGLQNQWSLTIMDGGLKEDGSLRLLSETGT